MSTSRWFLRRSSGAPRLRMFCFSYAGGNGSTYLQWQPKLDASIEIVSVQLPGRGSRLREDPITSLSTLIEQIAAEIQFPDRLPFIFFGHSLGALVAFELARYCRLRFMPLPLALIASGCDAPRFRSPVRKLHELEGDAFIEALAQYNGTPPELLVHKELMAMVAPAIRADFAMAANYQYRPGPLLDIPITVLSGRADVDMNLDQVGSWQLETSNECTVHWFNGDHFFINSSQQEVLDLINVELRSPMTNETQA